MPLFLHKFKRLINGEFPERLNFGFILYNASGDGNLKSVEISDMMDAVPPSGPVFKEWMELADTFFSILNESFKTPVFEAKRFNMTFRDWELSKYIAECLRTYKKPEFSLGKTLKDAIRASK